ncbi:MAG: hypothetical protein Q8R28_12075 [Dehalococcoidia bacterium]|nr:hypothetical protein [Dehalococcoidia bacterium]
MDRFVSVVTPERKLIRNNAKGQLLLFNLKSDPNEFTNLGQSNPPEAAELDHQARDWMTRHGIRY